MSFLFGEGPAELLLLFRLCLDLSFFNGFSNFAKRTVFQCFSRTFFAETTGFQANNRKNNVFQKKRQTDKFVKCRYAESENKKSSLL